MNEDGRSLIDQGASLSSHTTSDDQVRPQLMIKVNLNFNLIQPYLFYLFILNRWP